MLLDEFLDRKVVLFSTDRHDYAFLRTVASLTQSDRCVVYEVTGLESLFDLLEQAAVVVGSRMHTLIVAHTQGFPAIALNWQAKVGAFMSMVGGESRTFDAESISSAHHLLMSRIAESINRGVRMDKEDTESAIARLLPRLEVNDAVIQQLLVAGAGGRG